MSKKRETPKRPADRKPALGGNLVWSLAAAGVATLFAISLIGTVPELELSFTDLERLVLAVGREGDERWVSVVPASGAEGKTVRYGDLQDVVIGAFQVSGKVRQAGVPDVAEPAGHGAAAAARTGLRRFRTAKLPSENAESGLMKLLKEHEVPFRYEDPPSPWRNWLPMLFLTACGGGHS